MSEINRGVILAGGNGSRLYELTNGGNKHLHQVAGRTMLDYPLDNLKDMGIKDVTIVTNPEAALETFQYLQSHQGFRFNLELQHKALGMAHALGCAAVKEELFVVLCGDCYHSPTPKLDGSPQLWWTSQKAGNNGAIWDAETNRIIEKPSIGGMAIIGARVYDQQAIGMIDNLRPSRRGELEITDIDNWYLSNGLEMSYYNGFFGDMGTPQGLARVANHIREIA
jgi:glucose-1-phosphate thymidylyltransferase